MIAVLKPETSTDNTIHITYCKTSHSGPYRDLQHVRTASAYNALPLLAYSRGNAVKTLIFLTCHHYAHNRTNCLVILSPTKSFP